MLSIHDFQRTPELTRAVHLPARGEVDAIKIAARARTILDSVRLLRGPSVPRTASRYPWVRSAYLRRILALRAGSTLAYAPGCSRYRPGQVSLHELTHLYRAHTLNRRTQVFGVIGDPIGHSLSPLMHNSAFVAEKVNAVYLPFLVKDLRDFLDAVSEFGIRGFSVTIPHKQRILKYLKAVRFPWLRISAPSTPSWFAAMARCAGSNTDYVGVLRSLEEKARSSRKAAC